MKADAQVTQYDPAATVDFFAAYGDREWNRMVSSKLHELQLAIHEHYLRREVRAGMRVLEIGAGPGRFTLTLAAIGCRVVVADLSPVQIALNREKAKELGFASVVEDWVLADVCNLEPFADEAFDAVVAYGGPISYALDQRERAVRACLRVVRPGGPVLMSVMSLWGAHAGYLPEIMREEPIDNIREVARTGDLTKETNPVVKHYCHLFRPDELRELLTTCGLEDVIISGTETISLAWEEALSSIREDPHRWRALIELQIESALRPGSAAYGTHMIAVGRKRMGQTQGPPLT